MIDKVFSLLENICKAVLLWVLKIFRVEPSTKMMAGLVQFIRFGLVGVSNTIVGYVIYAIVILFYRGKDFALDYFVANLVSFVLGVLWSFVLNNKWVFTDGKAERSWIKTLGKTYVTYAFSGLFLNSILNWIWIDMVGLSKFISPILNMFITVPTNFILNKFWAYRGGKK